MPKATACNMPTDTDETERLIYTRMRDLLVGAHCADKRPSHKCAGEITITRDHVTLQCPRCGDARQRIV